MAGRKKEPVSVLLEKGKKHLTKKEIKERQEQEIKGFKDKIIPPKKLPKGYTKNLTIIQKNYKD